MQFLRRFIARLASSRTASAAWVALLAALLTIGYAGAIAHQYEHLDSSQPEVACQLCVAGDHHQPLPPRTGSLPPFEQELQAPGYSHLPLLSKPLAAAHRVRAPPSYT